MPPPDVRCGRRLESGLSLASRHDAAESLLRAFGLRTLERKPFSNLRLQLTDVSPLLGVLVPGGSKASRHCRSEIRAISRQVQRTSSTVSIFTSFALLP
jgi:hypothetical protein